MTAEAYAAVQSSLTAVLDGTSEGIAPDPHLMAFSGLHGGLVLAHLAKAMAGRASHENLRSATARFHRPATDMLRTETAPVRVGRSVSVIAARALAGGDSCADATAVFNGPPAGSWPEFAPEPPAAARPKDCPVYRPPLQFVPVSRFTEIRPTTPERPYEGGTRPELTAWVRLVEDERPPSVARLMFLVDALAPSYSAVLADLAPIPTVELTVRPGPALAEAASPWVLLRARTRAAGADGWTEEQIDAWGPDGAHLGSAHQLRVARSKY